MNIQPSNFLTLLTGIKQYQIPIYQRNYAWGRENCKRLLEDIIRAGTPQNPNHFIGSVIIREESAPVGVSVYSVIDGQQRMTTITLLLLALMEYWKNNPSSCTSVTTTAMLRSIKDTYLTNQQLTGISLFTRVLPKQGKDQNEYVNLLHGVNGTGAISSNYTYFVRELKRRNCDPAVIYNGINNAKLALVTLDATDNPQLLFEAVNDTGIDLTSVDLVRNWLFMGLSKVDQDRLYRAYWEPIENLITNSIDRFLFYFTELKTSSVVSVEYYGEFKKCLGLNAGNATAIESLLKELLRYAGLFSKLQSKNGFSDPALQKVINNIVESGKDLFTPLILKILDRNGNTLSVADATSMLRYLEAYIVRRDMIRVPTNTLSRAMIALSGHCTSLSDFIGKLKVLPYAQRMPDDSEMKTQLLLGDFYHLPRARDYLDRIEKSLNPAFALADLTIEHILPEKICTNNSPKKNVPATKVNDYNWELDLGAQAQATHDTYQHTLGNLTILPRDENTRMSDYRFDIKKNWPLSASNGFRYGYLHTPIRISQSLGNVTKWDKTAIENRCAEMVGYICKEWPHP